MTRQAVALTALFFAPLPTLAQEPYGVAQETAAWLQSVAARDPASGGLAWPASDRDPSRRTGLGDGAAGVGLFFVHLHRATGSSEALDVARQAADYVAHQYANGRTNGPDWLAGAAGGGAFFLALHEVAGDETALARAHGVARSLVGSGVRDAGGGLYWTHGPAVPRTYTGHAHGAAGIASFLLDVHRRTGDRELLAAAEDAYRWLTAHRIDLGEGAIGWRRLTDDGHAYHLWCGGSAGIVGFLEKLHRATGREEYREEIRRTADGFLRRAVVEAGGHAWPYTSNATDRSRPIVYCHGTTSVAVALYRAWAVTGDERYLEHARGGMRWVAAQSLRRGEGALWEHIRGNGWLEAGYFTGAASVGRAFLEAYRYDPRPEYLEQAKRAGRALADAAEHPAAGQSRWVARLDGGQAAERFTALYEGAAGVGLFFVELGEVLP